jgi:hypothetical protein
MRSGVHALRGDDRSSYPFLWLPHSLESVSKEIVRRGTGYWRWRPESHDPVLRLPTGGAPCSSTLPTWSSACVASLARLRKIIKTRGTSPAKMRPPVACIMRGDLPTAACRLKLGVFGGDTPTPDSTGVRDLIHLMDLAKVSGGVELFEIRQAGLQRSGNGTCFRDRERTPGAR